MSEIVYNGVLIRNVLLQSIDQIPVYDEEGGTDPIGIRTQAVFKGVVFVGELTPASIKTGAQVSGVLGNSGVVLHKLNEPRKRFIYRFADKDVLFDVSPTAVKPGSGQGQFGGGAKDLNGGPLPSVRVERVIGRKAIHVVFGIEFRTWDCDDPSPVVNLRYYVTEDIDEDWYRTRTFQGRLRLRSRASHPHAFRSWVIPPLQGGFKRDRMTFRESPDGLSLIFQIVDREMDAAPPFPATSWRGNFSISTYDGASVIEAVDVTLRGAPSVSKTDLLKLAMKIIDMKLNVLSKVEGQLVPVVVEDAMFSEALHANEITASMRIRHTKEDPQTRLLYIGNETFGKPLGASVGLDGAYDPGRFRVPVLPNSLAGLFTSAMQDPCQPSGIPATVIQAAEPEEEISSEGGERDKDEFDDIDEGVIEAALSVDEQKSIYTDYRISSEVQQKSGMIVVPLSAAVDVEDPPEGEESSAQKKKTVASIQLHAGMAIRTIRVVAERVGSPPKIPSPVSFLDSVNNIHHDYLTHSIESVGAKLAPDGVAKIYHVEMAIQYGLSRTLQASDLQYSGTLPYDTFELETNMLPASVFVIPGTPEALA